MAVTEATLVGLSWPSAACKLLTGQANKAALKGASKVHADLAHSEIGPQLFAEDFQRLLWPIAPARRAFRTKVACAIIRHRWKGYYPQGVPKDEQPVTTHCFGQYQFFARQPTTRTLPIPHDFFALAAAACWAFGSLLSVEPSRYLGAFAFTRWRMLSVAVMLWTTTLALSGLPIMSFSHFGAMAFSGLIGIFVGDTALYSAMNRLGPRRAGILFATHAIFSALLGFVVFGERMSIQAMLGAGLTIFGVMIAILLGHRKCENHAWESNHGHLGIGIALGLLAALCQALGSLVAKPAMAEGMDPIVASAIRVSIACGAHFFLLWLGVTVARPTRRPSLLVLAQTALSGLVSVALGMTLLLLALKFGDVGMVSILSSVTPILLLPLLWLRLHRPPAYGAWFGAATSIVGTALILSR